MNEALTLLFSMIGSANGVENVQNWFAVDPAVAQRMHAATRQSSAFLQRINVISVVEKAGQKIGIGGGLTAGRTNTDNNNRRHPKAKHVKMHPLKWQAGSLVKLAPQPSQSNLAMPKPLRIWMLWSWPITMNSLPMNLPPALTWWCCATAKHWVTNTLVM